MDTHSMINLEVEGIVLGCLINNNSLFYKLDRLDESLFNTDLNKGLYSYIKIQIEKGDGVTPQHFDGKYTGDELAQITEYLMSSVGILDVQVYINLLHDIAKKVKFYEIIKEAQSDDGIDIYDTINELNKIIDDPSTNSKIRTANTLFKDIMEATKTSTPCYSTGFTKLDYAMKGGVYSKKFYCFAARQKVGKTICLASISHNLGKGQVPHLFIAAEMGAEEIGQRLLAHDMGVNSVAFNNDEQKATKKFQEKLADVITQSKSKTIYVDSASIDFNRLKSLIISTCRKYKLKGVVLDYMQIVTGKNKGESEAEFQGRVAQGLAEICKREDIFIVTAAQLNRDGELRGSDGIRNAVDQLYYLHKAKSYDDVQKRYFTMEASRYTIQEDIGAEDAPSFLIDKHGPYLKEIESD